MNPSQDDVNEMTDTSSMPEPSVSELMGYANLIPDGEALTPEEIDTLGEVGNICMGTVATTMYALLERRVEITTPRVAVMMFTDVFKRFPTPLVVVEVEYINGIKGSNLLLLEEMDAALITDILMGGDGVVEEPVELTDLHISAINEIMNQLTGASATVLSQLVSHPVGISPPVSRRTTLEDTNAMALESDDLVIVITFDMEIEGLLNSQLVQVMPYDVGRELSQMLTASNALLSGSAVPPAPDSSVLTQPSAPDIEPAPLYALAFSEQPQATEPLPQFSEPTFTSYSKESLNLIHDIPVQVSVELGRTKKEISEILDFDSGTVIVLDKAAGDPVEIYVNGKLVASGEVVVIDENYGVRITALYT